MIFQFPHQDQIIIPNDVLGMLDYDRHLQMEELCCMDTYCVATKASLESKRNAIQEVINLVGNLELLDSESLFHLEQLKDILDSTLNRVNELLEKKKEQHLFEIKPLCWNSKLVVRHCTDKLYRAVQSLCSLGGNGSGEAIYGEMTIGSFQRIVDHMKKYLAFTKESKFLDIGSGVGKPTLHVSQDPGVALSMGIELKAERCFLLNIYCGTFSKTKHKGIYV